MATFRIYPSLLDAYQDYLDAEKTWVKYWGGSDNPSVSLDDFIAEAEAGLLDTINRVSHEPIEAADKGTCFNEVIDRINSGGKPINNEVEVRTSSDCEKPSIEAKMDGFTFLFDIGCCKDAAKYFEDCIPQHLCMAPLKTKYGIVQLYGYADEIRGDKVFDIKTTSSSYEYGKYGRKWQWRTYPYCLVESGEMESVTEFEYTVFVLGKNEPFTASMYRETYPYDHRKATEELRLFVENFIEFLFIHKDDINNERLWQQQEN